jgi:hypothetical protein
MCYIFDAGRSHFYLRESTQFNSIKVSFSFQKVLFSSVLGLNLSFFVTGTSELLLEKSSAFLSLRPPDICPPAQPGLRLDISQVKISPPHTHFILICSPCLLLGLEIRDH